MTPLLSAGETGVTFSVDGLALFGILHQPDRPRGAGVVLCNPLFEERKPSHGILVDAARALAMQGYSVLRFDYRGCGESEGAFADFALTDWETDTVAAFRYLADAAGCQDMTLAGVRMGASLCLRAAPRVSAARLVLWAPVGAGQAYLLAELRKKLMKEMITFGRSRVTREELVARLESGSSVDFDGYELTPRLYGEMTQLSLSSVAPPTGPVLLAELSPRDVLSGPSQQLRESLVGRGCAVTGITVNEKPFWNLIGREECPALIEQTVQWLGAN